MSALLLAVPLAAKSGEADKAGPIGLAVIIVLGIVCYFLFKSMSKHMKRVREEFPVEQPPTAAMPTTAPTTAPTTSTPTAPGAEAAGTTPTRPAGPED